MSLKAKTAIVGVGASDWSRSSADSLAAMQVKAALAALDDAAIGLADIDGILTTEGSRHAGDNPRVHTQIAEMLGLRQTNLAAAVPVGGGACGLSIAIARWAVASGRCRAVLVLGSSKLASVGGRTASGSGATDSLALFRGHSPTFEQTFGPLIISFYASVAQRHMHEYGTTHAQLAAVAVACRRHASLNPEAIMREPISVEDVLASRPISSPFNLLDCCINSDGAAALVVMAADRARDTPRPVDILGLGHASSSYFTGDLALPREDMGFSLTSTVGRIAAGDAFAEAEVDRADVDFAELYDNFTITPLVQLEDLGFCAKGEGGPFVEGGRIELGGELPVNTHGGHLSCNFSPAGYNHWIEAVRQLRGDCGERQVAGARLGLVSTVASTIATYGGVGILARGDA
ncbi:MAG: hypothetical protein QM729_20880 [Solirubrobacterales bacterium]